MTNYRMTIQYDGGRYKGWQRLGNEEQTIQGKIEKVLSQIAGKEIQIIGASRTDAGVHALEQTANFKLDQEIPVEQLLADLHQYLPKDISVTELVRAHPRFHARYHAKHKTYLYRIWNESRSHPFLRRYSMHVQQPLKLGAMRAAARYFVGEHDFQAFSNAKSKKKTTVRTIMSVDVTTHEGLIEIRITGDGFLHHMARKMVAILIETGLGNLQAADIPRIIAAGSREIPAGLADAEGLFLESIRFSTDWEYSE